jgi:hypothetical protein
MNRWSAGSRVSVMSAHAHVAMSRRAGCVRPTSIPPEVLILDVPTTVRSEGAASSSSSSAAAPPVHRTASHPADDSRKATPEAVAGRSGSTVPTRWTPASGPATRTTSSASGPLIG